MSDDQVLKVRPALSRTSRRIVDLVFLSSIVLFAALTSHNIAMAVGLLERSSTGNDASVATLLSAALIWLAWRRADDLTRVQGELA